MVKIKHSLVTYCSTPVENLWLTTEVFYWIWRNVPPAILLIGTPWLPLFFFPNRLCKFWTPPQTEIFYWWWVQVKCVYVNREWLNGKSELFYFTNINKNLWSLPNVDGQRGKYCNVEKYVCAHLTGCCLYGLGSELSEHPLFCTSTLYHQDH